MASSPKTCSPKSNRVTKSTSSKALPSLNASYLTNLTCQDSEGSWWGPPDEEDRPERLVPKPRKGETPRSGSRSRLQFLQTPTQVFAQIFYTGKLQPRFQALPPRAVVVCARNHSIPRWKESDGKGRSSQGSLQQKLQGIMLEERDSKDEDWGNRKFHPSAKQFFLSDPRYGQVRFL